MMTDAPRSLVLLVGSPKGLERSSSAQIAHRVTDKLESRGWTCQAFHVHQTLQDAAREAEMHRAVDAADVLLLSFPLYVDGLPGPVIAACERILKRERLRDASRPPVRFAAIVNCGFGEPLHNELARRMLQLFCEQAEFEWFGAVSLGAGGMVRGRIEEALMHVAVALHDDVLMPDIVERLTSKPLIPRWLYVTVGNHMWKRSAKKLGAGDRLRDRPYAES